jgi:subtilisin family serine protease
VARRALGLRTLLGRALLGRALLGAAALALLTTASPQHARADINAKRIGPLLRQAVGHDLLRDDQGRLPLLVQLPPGVTAEERALLPVAPGIGAIHLTPAQLQQYVATYDDVVPVVAPPRRKLSNHAALHWTNAIAVRDQTGLSGQGVVVGVIDTGIDAAHPDFRNEDGSTRIAWLLQREDPRGLQPELEQAFGCTTEGQSPCAVYDATDINQLLIGDGEFAPRDADGHGTHVTSLAAGNGGERGIYLGVAPAATLVVAAPMGGGGGFSDPDILNAARFIFDRAAALGMPAVLNVSLGSDFGPHDGTSALAKGLAAMVDGQPGRALVLATGNSGTLFAIDDDVHGIHTEAHVSPNAITRVPIQQAGASGKVDGGGFVWVTFKPGDDVNVGLEGPDGADWIPLTSPGEEAGLNEDGLAAGVVNNLVNGKTSLNAETNSAVVFWDGRWDSGEMAVLLQGRGDAQLWVTGSGGAAPGRTLGLNFVRALKNGTVAVPAAHEDLIAVGCTLNRTRWPVRGMPGQTEIGAFGPLDPAIEDSACYFSAAGPTPSGAMKPDLLAPGGLVVGAMSRDADPLTNPESLFNAPGCVDPTQPCFVVDDFHAVTSGTSMSAPQVTGAVALLLEREPTLTQKEIKEILQAGARRPEGVIPFDFQQGPGTLDLVGALQVLDQRAGNGGDADPARSFFVLSSPYARPDPGWPVQGTVQLRHEDGSVRNCETSVCSGLRLRVSGGVVLKQPTHVRAGTFQFAFSAPRGSGGTTLHLEVLYGDQSLGKRTLAVGVDAWAAGKGAEAVGGCSIGNLGQHGGAPGWWLCLAGLFGLRLSPGRRH